MYKNYIVDYEYEFYYKFESLKRFFNTTQQMVIILFYL